MNRIVITGATSFIGVHLIEAWLKEDCIIYAVVRPNSNNLVRIPQNRKVQVIELEMKEYRDISKYIKSADAFYHLAWNGVRAAQREDAEMQSQNYECAVVAMRVAREIGCGVFVGFGSQAEYGQTKGKVDENYLCNPTTEYGKEKLHACNTLTEMAKQYGMKFIWARIFSLYGKYDYSGTLIMSAIEKMKKNETIQMTECTQLWDYLNVEDAAEVFVKLVQDKCESGIYNIASGEIRPLKEFVEIIKQVIGSSSIIEYGRIPYGNEGPINLEPCVSKVEKALKWKKQINFEEGIRKCIEFDG